ncbi:TetR/AcrR family transcriptional regulator C-terminal domain-containing protein [Streptomyces sp. NPDC012769]|uniref:TetR/AcrR family transcriptional regulator C-terminal domain-containing protein n=1 Tax=Streptomyces sp. NPDC012769 TaxID=3364848 RepID=UPI0036A90704
MTPTRTSLTRRIEREGGDVEEAFGAVLKEAAEAASHFPRLRSRIASATGTGYAEASDDTFDFGLQSLLDGLQARLTRADGRPPSEAATTRVHG